MATNKQAKELLEKLEEKEILSKGSEVQTVDSLLKNDVIKKRFESVLQEKSSSFVANVLTLVKNDKYLSQVEPMSVLSGAMISATLDLPLDKNLGYAYLVPYKNKAQFILGYKGYIQLAQRSGQYKALNVVTIYEGELVKWNRLTEEIEFDPNSRKSDTVVGYLGYFELLNGFKKVVYWTVDDMEKHRIANNKGQNKNALSGVWASDYNAMAEKTILRHLLSKWGVLSIDMQRAVATDDSEIEMKLDDSDTSSIKVAKSYYGEEINEEIYL